MISMLYFLLYGTKKSYPFHTDEPKIVFRRHVVHNALWHVRYQPRVSNLPFPGGHSTTVSTSNTRDVHGLVAVKRSHSGADVISSHRKDGRAVKLMYGGVTLKDKVTVWRSRAHFGIAAYVCACIRLSKRRVGSGVGGGFFIECGGSDLGVRSRAVPGHVHANRERGGARWKVNRGMTGR
jgi:hypothetical protein